MEGHKILPTASYLDFCIVSQMIVLTGRKQTYRESGSPYCPQPRMTCKPSIFAFVE